MTRAGSARERGGNPRAAMGLHGAAVATGGADLVLVRGEWRGRGTRRGRSGGEVDLGLGAMESESGRVVGPGSVLRRVEGAEPDARPLPWVTDLCSEAAPGALADATVAPLVGGSGCDCRRRYRGRGGDGGGLGPPHGRRYPDPMRESTRKGEQ